MGIRTSNIEYEHNGVKCLCNPLGYPGEHRKEKTPFKIKSFYIEKNLKYKSYVGAVEYSDVDKCFYGKIKDIDDLVTYEADSKEDLQINFQNAVEDYLVTCKQIEI